MNEEIKQAYEKEVGKFQRSPIESVPLTPAQRRGWLFVIGWLIVLSFLCMALSCSLNYGG